MIDVVIAEAINKFGSGTFIDSLTVIISSYFFLATLLAVFVIVELKFGKNKKNKILFALVVGLILLVVMNTFVFKGVFAENIYFRERPYVAHSDLISPLGVLSTDTSFPSNHVSIIFLILGILVYYNRKYLPYSLVLGLVMGFARIHNGMHYLSDVVFGALFGIIYAGAGIYSAKKFE